LRKIPSSLLLPTPSKRIGLFFYTPIGLGDAHSMLK
jgi:hypothetical protein